MLPHRTRIKICGITREADVDAAAQAGADALGFVLYDKSPRAVSVARAADLVRRMPAFVQPVALLVNARPALLAEVAALLPGALLQFHGDETPDECRAAQRPYVRAVRMAPDVALLDLAHAHPSASALLLDAPAQGYGGGGKVFDWSLIPRDVPLPVVLSGGLSAANVTDGVLHARPWAVDVSSGVESAKGIKDALLMRRFCEAVREADARIADATS